ncbi:MAG: C10 family peptidase [Paludibacteraceae bacterium]|nr:C10 family peptidase [Paludibacteraceae bacterium]
MKIKNLSFALLVLLASCQDKEDEMVIKGSNESDGSCIRISALYSAKHTIPEEEAEENALQMMENLYGYGNGLKSGRIRAVENVQAITKAKSSLKNCNSQLPDTLAYVVSFADSEGFCIVSADDRVVTPVLACVEKGTYSSGMDIPGLQLMVQKAQNYVASSIEYFEDNKDACLSYLETLDEIPTESKSLKATSNTTKGPYLTTKWGQDSPYNKKCPKCTHCKKKQSVAGCFPVAMAQVLAYHKKGILSKSQWNTVLTSSSSTSDNLIAQAMYKIGSQNGADYGCGDCGGTLAGLTWSSKNGGPWRSEWLENLGYNAGRYDYNSSKLKALLEKGPVMMTGKATEGGHAWVADGYQTITLRLPVFSSGGIKFKNRTFIFFHNNWGWSGECDGYFIKDCFDVSEGSYDDSSLPNSQPYNFNTNLFCTEIVPK